MVHSPIFQNPDSSQFDSAFLLSHFKTHRDPSRCLFPLTSVPRFQKQNFQSTSTPSIPHRDSSASASKRTSRIPNYPRHQFLPFPYTSVWNPRPASLPAARLLRPPTAAHPLAPVSQPTATLNWMPKITPTTRHPNSLSRCTILNWANVWAKNTRAPLARTRSLRVTTRRRKTCQRRTSLSTWITP
jgi:hypothetical protein